MPYIERTDESETCLTEDIKDLLRRSSISQLLSMFLNILLGVPASSTSVKVNGADCLESLSLPEVSAEPEEQDDWEGEVCLKETFGGVNTSSEGPDGNVELGNQDEDNHANTDPRTNNTESSLEGDFINRVTLVGPCLTETDMSSADGTPSEEGSQSIGRARVSKLSIYKCDSRGAAYPDKARSQSKITGPEEAKLTYPKRPNPMVNKVATRGLPALSM